MNDIPLLAPLRQSADPKAVDQIELLIEHAPDRDLNRINALAFATGALAVLRLTTSSNLVGCCTGKSEGLKPFKILSTNPTLR